MLNGLYLVVCAAAAYFVGAIPFGYIAGKVFAGIDVREHGSRNPGATNVLRVVGVGPGLLVLALDALKGLAPVLLAAYLAPKFGADVTPQIAGIVAGVAAILGHVFPVFLSGRGGKGVATAAGVCLALLPLQTAIALVTFAIVVGISRYVSLGSISAAVALVVAFFLTTRDLLGANLPLTIFVLALGALVIARHKTNIRRLVRGEENRLSFSRKKTPPENPGQD